MRPIYEIGFVTAQGWHGHHPSGVLAAASAATGGELKAVISPGSSVQFFACVHEVVVPRP
jgi:hypothetical protein